MEIKDILDYFDKFAHYKVLEDKEKTFVVKDVLEEDIFEVSKLDWYKKIETWLIEETIMDCSVNKELDYNDVLNICLKVSILDKAIKESE